MGDDQNKNMYHFLSSKQNDTNGQQVTLVAMRRWHGPLHKPSIY